MFENWRNLTVGILIGVGLYVGILATMDYLMLQDKPTAEAPAKSQQAEAKSVLRHIVELRNCFGTTDWVVFIFSDRTTVHYYPSLRNTLKRFVEANSRNTVKLKPDGANCA